MKESNRSLRVVVADADPAKHDSWRQALEDLEHEVVLSLTAGGELGSFYRLLQFDLLMCGHQLSDMTGLDAIRRLYQDEAVPVLYRRASDCDAPTTSWNGLMVVELIDPSTSQDLSAAIETLWQQFSEYQLLRSEAGDTRQALQDCNTVKAATRAIQKRVAVDDHAAFELVRKLALDDGVTIAEAARWVLKEHERTEDFPTPESPLDDGPRLSPELG
jgi:AmiR/NasT family two-component response regulator